MNIDYSLGEFIGQLKGVWPMIFTYFLLINNCWTFKIPPIYLLNIKIKKYNGKRLVWKKLGIWTIVNTYNLIYPVFSLEVLKIRTQVQFKRDFIIEKLIAWHFVQYKECFSKPRSFYVTQIIVPILKSRTSDNHDKGDGF